MVYVYPHLIPFDRRGPAASRTAASRCGASWPWRGRVAPELKVLPWVGGLRVGYRRQRAGTLDLADLGQRQRIVAECRGLIDEGFDGIHVNVEPVDDGNVDFLSLLRALRTAVGDEQHPLPLRHPAGAGPPAGGAQLLLDAGLLRARGRTWPTRWW